MPRSLLIVLGLLWLPLLLSPACAKSPDGSPASAAQISERIDALFDPSTFAFGAGVLAIVENGEVTVLKGYGFEDAGRTRPTDPAETRFRIGSVSKTFAGLAIAQLLAEGKISSFDDPVSMYLPNVALGQNGRPITLRDLLTHEAGFAEGDFPYQHGARSTPAADDAYMTRAAPPLLYPPGAVTGYSNYGAALVGHVVAAASGMSFEAYLNTRVFGPAGMGHSLYADTPKAPPRLAYAASYYPNGDAISHPSDWALDTAIAPAGSVVSSGADMAAYMIGLLQDGPLTTPAVREAAFTRLGGPHPQVQGYGSLFMLNQWGDERVVEHGGYLPGYRSYLVLFPERRVGVFVAVSGEPGPPSLGGLLPPPFRAARYVPKAGAITRSPSLSELRAASIEPVLGRYPKPEGGVLEAGAPDLSAYAGSYLAARRNPSRDLWIQTLLLGAKMDVRATPDGLQVGGLAGYKPIGKDMFWREPKPKSPSGWYDLLVFRRDADGRIRDFSFLYSDTVWEPVQGIGSPPGAMALLPLGLLGLLTGLFVGFWPRGAAGKWFIWLAPFATIATPLLFFVGWPDAPDTVFRWLYRDAGSRLPFLLGAHAAAGLLLATIGAAAATLWRPRAQHLATAVAVRVHAGILLASAAVTLAAFWGLNWIL